MCGFGAHLHAEIAVFDALCTAKSGGCALYVALCAMRYARGVLSGAYAYFDCDFAFKRIKMKQMRDCCVRVLFILDIINKIAYIL